MRGLQKAAIVAAVALPLSTVPLAAQNYRWDFNINGGYSWMGGRILDDDDVDFLDEDLDDGIGLDNGFTLGTQLGYWFGKRFGLRGNFAWTSSGVEGRRNIFTGDPLELFDYDVNLYGLTLDALVRLNKPRDEWGGTEWLPYVTFGMGAQWIDPSGGDFFVVDEFPVVNPLDEDFDGIAAAPIRCSAALNRCAALEGGTKFTGLLGIGLDLRLSPSFAARFELGDRFYSVPVETVVLNPNFPTFFQSEDDIDGGVNQLYLTLGLSYLFGLEAPMRAAVLPPPAPAPAPTPPPAPRFKQITVCVVDPSSAQGLRTVNARESLENGDTLVARNGQPVLLSEAVGSVPVAGSADWYIRGAPLVIGGASSGLQYVSVNSERVIEPNQLAYIGTVDGVPVFTDRSSVPGALRNVGPNTDLNRLVGQSADTRKALDSVQTLYVPLRATGCSFQALRKVQEVRKNGLPN